MIYLRAMPSLNLLRLQLYHPDEGHSARFDRHLKNLLARYHTAYTSTYPK